jgi:hypothetical protein
MITWTVTQCSGQMIITLLFDMQSIQQDSRHATLMSGTWSSRASHIPIP